MASAGSKINKLAETVRIPGGRKIGETLSDILQSQLIEPVPQFVPGQSSQVSAAQNRLSNLLDRSPDLPGSLSFLNLRENPDIGIRLSPQEQNRRKRLAGQLSQQVRDSLSKRGLNVSEAGADVEGRTLSRFFENLAAQDFEQKRVLTAEDMAKERLRIESESRLFTQQIQAEALKQGREGELFNRQMSVIDRVLNQADIAFNREQTVFATNLAAAGIPVNKALQFMALVQRGDMAAADLILQGVAIDQEARNAIFNAVGGLSAGVGQVAGTVAGAKIGGIL